VTPVSVVVLTWNRRESLRATLAGLTPLAGPELEIIVVDNGSGDGTAAMVAADFPHAACIALAANEGVGARNHGLRRARGDIVVCLDDDVSGLDEAGLARLRRRFAAEPALGAVCLKVVHAHDGRVCDWVHHRPLADADLGFPTYEITEGAVAFRRRALAEAGWYPADFFISHEGLDLAFRLMNRGWEIVYDGDVTVRHSHHGGGRSGDRRHYYDTRNLFWVAARNLPAGYALRYLARNLGAMAVYALRDGRCLTWLRAVRDGLAGLPAMRRRREVWTKETAARVRAIDAHRPGFLYLARRRWSQKNFNMD